VLLATSYSLKAEEIAAPDILSAAKAERNPLTKVHMVAFAAGLGSSTGHSMLDEECANDKEQAWLRIVAAEDMINIVHRRDCLPTGLCREHAKLWGAVS
jgi:hypothetical protein